MSAGARERSHTFSEVAAICGASVSTVAKMVGKHRLRALRVPGSRHRRIRRLDLVEWLANRPDWHWLLIDLCGPLPDGWPNEGGSNNSPDATRIGD